MYIVYMRQVVFGCPTLTLRPKTKSIYIYNYLITYTIFVYQTANANYICTWKSTSHISIYIYNINIYIWSTWPKAHSKNRTQINCNWTQINCNSFHAMQHDCHVCNMQYLTDMICLMCNQYAINVRKMFWPWHPWHPWYRDVPGQHGATVPGDFVAIGLHMESGHPTSTPVRGVLLSEDQ